MKNFHWKMRWMLKCRFWRWAYALPSQNRYRAPQCGNSTSCSRPRDSRFSASSGDCLPETLEEHHGSMFLRLALNWVSSRQKGKSSQYSRRKCLQSGAILEYTSKHHPPELTQKRNHLNYGLAGSFSKRHFFLKKMFSFCWHSNEF